MYVKHTFLSKSNTIVRGEKENLSLSPILELSYGGITTRGLVFFDVSELRSLHEEKVYPDLERLKHRLKMYNTGSIQHKGINKCFPDQKLKEGRQRAVSFDLVFFKIPQPWDAGRGFDYTQDIYYGKHRGYSEYGSNWFDSMTGTRWETYNYVNVNGPVEGVTYDGTNTYDGLSESPYYDGEDMDRPDDFRVQLHAYSESYTPETGAEYTELSELPDPVTDESPDYVEIHLSDEDFTEVDTLEEYSGYYVKTTEGGTTAYYVWFPETESYTVLDDPFSLYKYYSKNYAYYTRKLIPTPGIYSTEKLEHELGKYREGTSGIIVGVQHFDYGNENIDIDITGLVNSMIDGKADNFGIGVAFAPCLEETCVKPTQYVGFFTGHTNSFFEPYVETVYEDRIIDDRADFYLDKTNRLYLHSIIGGKHVNLDALPSCTIDNTAYEVKQAGKGLYYVEIANFTSDLYEPVTMFYDKWSGLSYNGRSLPDVERFFTTKSPSEYYNFGFDTTDSEYRKIVPNVYGIDNGQKLMRDGVVMVNIEYVIKYTKKQEPAIYDSEYRLYAKQGEKEITVIDWQPVHCDYIKSYFYLDTKSLVPSRYFVDIRCRDDFEETVYRKMLEFEISSRVEEIEC